MLRTLKWQVSVNEHIVINCILILSIFLWLALICQFPKVLLHIFTTHSTDECLRADEVIRSGSYDVKQGIESRVRIFSSFSCAHALSYCVSLSFSLCLSLSLFHSFSLPYFLSLSLSIFYWKQSPRGVL